MEPCVLDSLGNGRCQIVNRAAGIAPDGVGNATIGDGTTLWVPYSNTNQQ